MITRYTRFFDNFIFFPFDPSGSSETRVVRTTRGLVSSSYSRDVTAALPYYSALVAGFGFSDRSATNGRACSGGRPARSGRQCWGETSSSGRLERREQRSRGTAGAHGNRATRGRTTRTRPWAVRTNRRGRGRQRASAARAARVARAAAARRRPGAGRTRRRRTRTSTRTGTTVRRRTTARWTRPPGPSGTTTSSGRWTALPSRLPTGRRPPRSRASNCAWSARWTWLCAIWTTPTRSLAKYSVPGTCAGGRTTRSGCKTIASRPTRWVRGRRCWKMTIGRCTPLPFQLWG